MTLAVFNDTQEHGKQTLAKYIFAESIMNVYEEKYYQGLFQAGLLTVILEWEEAYLKVSLDVLCVKPVR